MLKTLTFVEVHHFAVCEYTGEVECQYGRNDSHDRNTSYEQITGVGSVVPISYYLEVIEHEICPHNYHSQHVDEKFTLVVHRLEIYEVVLYLKGWCSYTFCPHFCSDYFFPQTWPKDSWMMVLYSCLRKSYGNKQK